RPVPVPALLRLSAAARRAASAEARSRGAAGHVRPPGLWSGGDAVRALFWGTCAELSVSLCWPLRAQHLPPGRAGLPRPRGPSCFARHGCALLLDTGARPLTLAFSCRWALWFFKNDKSKTWQANLRLISKFDTVEDFWALYNHIQLSSNLMPGCDYSLFKDGIEPMWEDEKNKRGGRWLITLNKQQRRSDLDRFWLETLLCLIGESFDDYSDDVCGAVVNVRTKGDKIAIWTTECENREAVTHIGRVYKERLGLPAKIVIGYQSHADTATKSGSTTKNRFVV
ncbi:PREDICTED: eukaryotic translation initiation factor 4E-like, partial [Condylura cristata]|uniref:eukaryotic translation initiation factor 4E-like n=1 Tax=Condylura cristata TaxID=143302 RepID=UPI000642B2F5